MKRGVSGLVAAALAGLSAVLLAGCAGAGTAAPDVNEAMIPEIDMNRPATVATATFALG